MRAFRPPGGPETEFKPVERTVCDETKRNENDTKTKTDKLQARERDSCLVEQKHT